jgi:UDP-N-acetylmuramoylalanine--D-glutamate ligase
MIEITGYQDKLVAVYGLGRTGLSAIRTMVAGGAQVICWDDDPGRRDAGAALGALAVAPDLEAWSDVVLLILSPGVPLTHPEPHLVVRLANQLGVEIVGDTELFARSRPAAPIIAITGTNGKSTTTALVAHLMNACGRTSLAGGNIGMSVLDFDVLGAEDAYVVELSSYQIDLTSGLRPAVTVLLNLSPDHLDRHGDMAGYVAAKRRLFEMAGSDARHVIGVDDERSSAIADSLSAAGAKVTRISGQRELANGIFGRNGRIYQAEAGTVIEIADLAGIETLRGAHNWQNAAAAMAVMEAMGFDPMIVTDALHSFKGLPHRMELAAMVDGIRFVNDSKATNSEAAAQALAAYQDIYWIAGGIAKQGGIADLAPFFGKIRHAYLIGEAAEIFADTLGDDVECSQSGNLSAAIAAAYAAAQGQAGGEPVVLLSPACASFDQFDSFEARGQAFCDIVAEIEAAANAESAGPVRAGGAA